MKTFIFIFIVVLGFFFYLFTNSDKTMTQQTKERSSYALEDIETKKSIQIDQEIIKEETTIQNEAPIAIPEDQTFDTIKNILKEVSGKEYAPEITLNTRINSYLYTVDAKKKFKQSIASSFNLSYDEVEKGLKDNKLVWDWVNQLKE
ncbi:MAG TPA: hypothetical protein EYG75_05040 [Campylobacterales bacterium]|nr:hypothetical protein [Campylobacterales bacterium]